MHITWAKRLKYQKTIVENETNMVSLYIDWLKNNIMAFLFVSFGYQSRWNAGG